MLISSLSAVSLHICSHLSFRRRSRRRRMTPEGRKEETQAQSEASASRNTSAKANEQPGFRGLQHNHHSQRARQHHSHMGEGQLDTVSATSLSSTCLPAQTWPTTADLLSVLHVCGSCTNGTPQSWLTYQKWFWSFVVFKPHIHQHSQ